MLELRHLVFMAIIAGAFGCGSGVDSGSGGAGGHATSSSSSSSSGGAESCSTCVGAHVFTSTGTACDAAEAACQADATCAAWLGCTDACLKGDATASCYQACDAAGASAQSLFGPVYACVCDACASSCAGGCA